MTKAGVLPLCTLLLAMACPALARSVAAVRTDGVRLDGVLEAEWFAGALADSFIQRNPVCGASATLPTRVYVLFDADALYFGFVCLDTAPDSIRRPLQRHDNDRNSDFVDIYLDSFHDRRNCYWFTITAAGVQAEGTIANENSYDSVWDGLWQSAVGQTDSGWVAEVRIPLASIRHGGPRPDGWGINFARNLERRQEVAYWQFVDRDRGFRVSEMGILSGLEHIASSEHWEILPHAVGRWDAPARDQWVSRNEAENLGLLVKLVPATSWTADVAYQPDFAQVDVDDEVINLSDYPVYLAEKRPFFIEMKDIFDTAPISLFYTRRVADPDFGLRLTGQPGPLRGSVLAARDRDYYGRLREVGVGRTLWNMGRVSTLGLTGTYLQQGNSRAAAGAFDTRIRWGLRNRLLLAGAMVDRGTRATGPVEGQASVVQDCGIFLAGLYASYLGRDYNINDLGWGSYSNTAAQTLSANKSYYPKRSPFQLLYWMVETQRRTLADGRLQEGYLNLDTYVATRSNWRAGCGVEWGTDHRRRYVGVGNSAPFRDNFYESYGGFVPEFHPYGTRRLWLESDPRLPVEFYAQFFDGNYREGHRWGVDPSVTVKPRGNLDLKASMVWQQVRGVADLDNYRVNNFRLWRLRARYSPSLNVSFRGTLQWVERDQDLLANLLLAWNWSPGSWLYLVYDETRGEDPLRRLAYADPGDRTLRVKLTYFLSVPWPRARAPHYESAALLPGEQEVPRSASLRVPSCLQGE